MSDQHNEDHFTDEERPDRTNNVQNELLEEEYEVNESEQPEDILAIERLDPFTYLDLYDTLQFFLSEKNESSAKTMLFNIKDCLVFPGKYLPIQIQYKKNVKIVEKYFSKKNICIVLIDCLPYQRKIGSLCRLISYNLYNDSEMAYLGLLSDELVEITNMDPIIDADGSNTLIYMALYKPEYIDETSFNGFNCSDPMTRQLYSLGHLKKSQNLISLSNCHLLSLKDSMNIIILWLNSCFKTNASDFPDDPYGFFITVISIVPLSISQQFDILQHDSLVLRMKLLAEFFDKGSYIGCARCDIFLATSDDVSSEIFWENLNHINPEGWIYNIIPFKYISNHGSDGLWNGYFTWFTDYMWQLVKCHRCSTHLGWKYKGKINNLHLPQFYGIIRSRIKFFTQNTPGYNILNLYDMGDQENHTPSVLQTDSSFQPSSENLSDNYFYDETVGDESDY